MISTTKNYHKFGMFLNRHKIQSGHALAKLFIQKFAIAKPLSGWKSITFSELKDLSIFKSGKWKSYVSWRTDMVKKGILICMATKDEMKEDTPNYKANMFKPGDLITKYIEEAIIDTIPQRVENIENKIEDIDILKSEVKELKHNVENLTHLILKALPPDTEIRRKIVVENIHNHDRCLELLISEQSQKVI